MTDKFGKEVKESQEILSNLGSTLDEIIAKKSNGSNGNGVKGWFALVKLRDAIQQTVSRLLEVEKEINPKKEVVDETEDVENSVL